MEGEGEGVETPDIFFTQYTVAQRILETKWIKGIK